MEISDTKLDGLSLCFDQEIPSESKAKTSNNLASYNVLPTLDSNVEGKKLSSTNVQQISSKDPSKLNLASISKKEKKAQKDYDRIESVFFHKNANIDEEEIEEVFNLLSSYSKEDYLEIFSRAKHQKKDPNLVISTIFLYLSGCNCHRGGHDVSLKPFFEAAFEYDFDLNAPLSYGVIQPIDLKVTALEYLTLVSFSPNQLKDALDAHKNPSELFIEFYGERYEIDEFINGFFLDEYVSPFSEMLKGYQFSGKYAQKSLDSQIIEEFDQAFENNDIKAMDALLKREEINLNYFYKGESAPFFLTCYNEETSPIDGMTPEMLETFINNGLHIQLSFPFEGSLFSIFMDEERPDLALALVKNGYEFQTTVDLDEPEQLNMFYYPSKETLEMLLYLIDTKQIDKSFEIKESIVYGNQTLTVIEFIDMRLETERSSKKCQILKEMKKRLLM